MSNMGRPKRFGSDSFSMLREIASANPMATLDELTPLVDKRMGQAAHSATVRKALHEAGVTRAKPIVEPAAHSPPKRYG